MLTQVIAEVDERLDAMLSESEIEFEKPAHMVHLLDRDQLLEQIALYCDIYCGEPTTFCDTPTEVMTDEQLRKLALWLYEEVGGTHSCV